MEMEEEQGGGSQEGERKGKRKDGMEKQFFCVIFKYGGLFIMCYFSAVNIKL